MIHPGKNDVNINDSLAAVSCPTERFCMATDETAAFLTFDGRTWSKSALATKKHGQYAMTSLSCTSATFCVSDDDLGGALMWNGSAWRQVPGAGVIESGVSCTSTSFCIAGDALGRVVTFDGSSWSPPQQVTPPTHGNIQAGIADVSCATKTFCVAVSATTAYTFQGSTWSSGTYLGPDPETRGMVVSCAAPHFCLAINNSGGDDQTGPLHSFAFDGTRWTAAIDLGAQDGTVSDPTLSCVSATFCMTVYHSAPTNDDDSTPRSSVWDGRGWGNPQIANKAGAAVNSLACPSTRRCVGVGYYEGYAWN